MPQPDLSICIPNWNCRDHLCHCLESIAAARDGLMVETIVVDNASSDGSAEMVARDFPWVILVRNEANRGFARANNQAAALSHGRYLLFLNNDTLVRRGCLRALVRYLDEHSDVGMVGPRVIGRDGRPQRSYRYRPTIGALLHRILLLRCTGLFRRAYRRSRRRAFDADTERRVEVLQGAAVCMPRSVFFGCGGWDEQYPFGVEDADLSARVARTHPLVFYPGAEIVHLGRMSSRGNSGFACVGLECGHARYLRQHLLGPAGLLAYKLLFTASLPLALAFQALRHLGRRLRYGPAAVGQPHSELTALWYLATRGLPRFWRS